MGNKYEELATGSVGIPSDLKDIVTWDVTQHIDFSWIDGRAKQRLLYAIRNGIGDAAQGKVATLYHTLCKAYHVPYAYYGENRFARTQDWRNKENTTGVVLGVCHITATFTADIQEHLEAMQRLAGGSSSAWENGLYMHGCCIPKNAIIDTLAQQLTPMRDRLAEMNAIVKEGRTINITATVI